jgi:GntR family transcriptional regulator, transcriptional repressor for pyruvate dehydrogenase complex
MRPANLAFEPVDVAPAESRTASVSGGLWESGADTLSARIVRQICAALFADELTPGERLGTEASLAQRFGVSRMAIRDSLRSLAAAGILDIKVGQRGGIFVAVGNPERLAETLAIQIKLIGVNIEEILDAQIAIEVTAAGLAARNATDSDIAGLKAEIAAMEREVDSNDAFTRASLGFHESIVAASRNRVLIAQFKALRHILLPLYSRRTTTAIALRALASHRALVACIEARDPDAARDLMRRRLEAVRAGHLAAADQDQAAR